MPMPFPPQKKPPMIHSLLVVVVVVAAVVFKNVCVWFEKIENVENMLVGLSLQFSYL